LFVDFITLHLGKSKAAARRGSAKKVNMTRLSNYAFYRYAVLDFAMKNPSAKHSLGVV
jgi:hypothetical protein